MNITSQTHLGIGYISGKKNALVQAINSRLDKYAAQFCALHNDSELTNGYQEWTDCLKAHSNYNPYVFSKESRTLYRSVRVDNSLDFNIFQGLKIYPSAYYFDEDNFALFNLDETGFLQGMFVHNSSTDKNFLQPFCVELNAHDILNARGILRDCLKELVRAILYVQFTSPALTLLASGESTEGSLEQLTNKTVLPFTLVHVSWGQHAMNLLTMSRSRANHWRFGRGWMEQFHIIPLLCN